jgi:hypothetical protein
LVRTISFKARLIGEPIVLSAERNVIQPPALAQAWSTLFDRSQFNYKQRTSNRST